MRLNQVPQTRREFLALLSRSGLVAAFAQCVKADNGVQPSPLRAMTVASLPATATNGDAIELAGFHAPGDGGGGALYWDAAAPKSTHNGGTIIDPGKAGQSVPWPGTYFTPALSGVGCWVRRSVVVTPEFFGAAGDWDGDTGTDDSEALQAMMTQCANRSIEGRLTARAYKITKRLSVKGVITTLTIRGAGKYASRIVMPQTWNGSTGNMSVLWIGDTVAHEMSRDVTISGISFEYTSRVSSAISNPANAPVVWIHKVRGLSFTDNRVVNGQYIGLYAPGAENFKILRCDIVGTRRDGIQLSNTFCTASAPMTPCNGIIADNYISDCRDDGISVGASWKNDPDRRQAFSIRIENNMIEKIIFGSGIFISGVDGFSVRGNIIRNCHKGGIRAVKNYYDAGYPLKNGVISRNVILNNQGIAANDTVEGVTVTPNRSAFTGRAEIFLGEDSALGQQFAAPSLDNVHIRSNFIVTNCNNGIYKSAPSTITDAEFSERITIESNQFIFTDPDNADDHRGVFISRCNDLAFKNNLIQGFVRTAAVFRKCAGLKIEGNRFLDNCANSTTATTISVLDENDATFDSLDDFSNNLMVKTSGTLARMLHIGNAGGSTNYRYIGNRRHTSGATVTSSDIVVHTAADPLSLNNVDSPSLEK